MKFLILLAILASCGKNQMPSEKDYSDADGDGIPGYQESISEKDIANIQTIEELEAVIEFSSAEVNYKYQLNNRVDLTNHIKDVLVRNPLVIKESQHFAEFNKLKIEKKILSKPYIENLTKVRISIPQEIKEGANLYYTSGETKLLLSPVKKMMEVILEKDQIEAILEERASFQISGMDTKKEFHLQTKEEEIRNKTIRVLMHKKSSTSVFYVSKELNTEAIISLMKISDYSYIDEQQLLTTQTLPTANQWWVRRVEGKGMALYFGNLQEISQHYLQGFEKFQATIKRDNGVSVSSLNISKHLDARVLLKINSIANYVEFREELSTRGQTGGYGDYWQCKDKNRIAYPIETNYTMEQLNKDLTVNAQNLSYFQDFYRLNEFSENQKFHELIFDHLSFNQVELKFNNLPSSAYVPVGFYETKCRGQSYPVIKLDTTLRTNESLLQYNVEAYVEKI